jgi:hypothetical protein
MFSFSTHVSQACVTTGLTNVLYIRSFISLYIALKYASGVKSLVEQDCDPHTVITRTACNRIIHDVLANMLEILAMIFVTDLKMAN